MQSRIVLISDDVDFFEYISPKLNLRKSDELFKFGFDAGGVSGRTFSVTGGFRLL